MAKGKGNGRALGKLNWVLGIIFACSIMVVLFITSFDMTLYTNWAVYEKEYEKHEVLKELDMSMEDVMYVTEEMMEYLRGNRERLSVITSVEGTYQDFFNFQDRFHMKEVRALFLGGLMIRKIALFTTVISLLTLLLRRVDLKTILPRAYSYSLVALIIPMLMLGVGAAVDFDTFFVKFHELFFDNDLWIFDPEHDFMIRMLPEGLFYDMTFKIGSLFLLFLIVLLIVSIIAWKVGKNGEKKKKLKCD